MSIELPDGWRFDTLANLTEQVKRGAAPNYSTEPTGVFAISQKCVRDGSIDLSVARPHNPTKAIPTKACLQPGDVCVNSTGTGTLGRVALWEHSGDKFFADTHVTIVRPDKDKVEPFMLAAYLGAPSTTETIYRECVTGSTNQIELSAAALSQLIVPVPLLDEQRRIAEVLRSVDDAIAASQATLQQSEVALSALSDELFSAAISGGGSEWSQHPLEDMLDNIIDYRGVPPPKADSGIPLLTAKNVRFGYLDFEPREYIADKDYDSWMRRGLPSAGDIMFTTEAPLGNVAEFPNIKAALGQRTLTLVPKTGALDAKFLKWLLLSKPAQDLIWSHATGSTAKGIKQRTFRKLKFGFPALDEQVRISELLEDVGAARAAAKRSKEAYAIMKAHLLSDLLSGRVRVPA